MSWVLLLSSFSLLLVTQLRNEKTKAAGNLNNFPWKQLDQNANSDSPLTFAWQKVPGATPPAGWACDPDQLPRMEVGSHHEALLGTGPKPRTTVLTGSGWSLLPLDPLQKPRISARPMANSERNRHWDPLTCQPAHQGISPSPGCWASQSQRDPLGHSWRCSSQALTALLGALLSTCCTSAHESEALCTTPALLGFSAQQTGEDRSE